MTEHELEVAAQVAVDVIADYIPDLFDESLDTLKRRILNKLREQFELNDDCGWEPWNP